MVVMVRVAGESQACQSIELGVAQYLTKYFDFALRSV
jgi:hypothetical protein